MDDKLEAYREFIEKIGIYELRSEARKVGVPSPTTKKREELINAIMEIKISGIVPDKKSRAGRPVKKFIITESNLSDDEEISKRFIVRKEEPYLFKFEQPVPEGLREEKKTFFFTEGVVRKTSKNTFYIYNNLSTGENLYIYIKPQIVIDNNLYMGDYIKGSAYFTGNGEISMLSRLDTVNGKTCELTYNDSPELKLPNNALPLNSINVFEGSVINVQYASTKEICDTITESVNTLNRKQYTNVVLGLESSTDTYLRLNNIKNKIELITQLDANVEHSYEVILDAINCVKTLFARGHKVVLYIIDILNLYKILDMYFLSKKDTEVKGHATLTHQIIRNLFAMCRASEDCSITIISSYLKTDAQDFEMEIKELKKYCS